jgi:formylglycine-generating enzyme required for sulfatase activity
MGDAAMMNYFYIALRAVAAGCWIAVPCSGASGGETAPQVDAVLISGAAFTMGTPLKSNEPEYHKNEAPLKVSVKSFRIGKFPVTAEQMSAFLNSEAAQKAGPESLYYHKDVGQYRSSPIVVSDRGIYVPREGAELAPANQVTWKGAVLFCRWLSDQTGKIYRLPSEAEWELAARGAEGRKWPWGDKDPDPKYGERYQRGTTILEALSELPSDLRGKPRPYDIWPKSAVGSHPANATKDGIHDLLSYNYHGEWCANRYFDQPTAEQATDTTADLDNLRPRRVLRGTDVISYPSGPKLLRGTEYGYRTHYGRPWSRIGISPDPLQGQPQGFRVVEEFVESRNAP